MFAALSNQGKAIWFYAIALAIAVFAAVGSARDGFQWLIAIYMFSPLIAVLAVQFVITRDWRSAASWRSLGVMRAGLRAWPLAITAPILMLLAANLVVWSTGIGTFSWPAALGSPLTWLLLLVPHIVVGCIMAFGEEVGWRGYLLPKLVGLGVLPAMLLTGLLHAIWHFPVILLTPFYHSAGSRWIVLPEFTILLTLAGVFYGYLRYLTGSVWPAVITHATFNQLLEDLGLMTTSASPATLEYVGGESGLLPIVALAIIVAALLSGRRQGAPDPWGPAAP